LEFCMDSGQRIQKLCVTEVSLEEVDQPEERQPSVVLRKFEQGSRLWDIAKQYRAACSDILAANQAENEQAIPVGKLLLIPRRKV